jgi:3'(2'), 5'-bisphosphate nucleotidase
VIHRTRQGAKDRQEGPFVTPDRDITPDKAARLLDDLTAIVARASAAILAIAQSGVARETKDDGSPVTAADKASELVILRDLAALLPNVPVVSEESVDNGVLPLGGCFVLVDPLDGTREYIAGRNEYTVNLAIVRDGTPLAGIVCAPGQAAIWRGLVGKGAQRLQLRADKAEAPMPIAARKWPAAKPVAAVSRSHLDPNTQAFLAKLGPVDSNPAGSSVKFCRIAEGVVDVYPRLGTTCEWDIAAGHAVLTAAGGIVTKPDGGALSYGNVQGDFRVPSFIAWGDPAKARSL